MTTPVIELKGIYKAFSGNQVLKNINLTINPGEIVCICGENGSGKSTLIKIISGVYTFDAGEIKINGKSFPRLASSQSIDEGIQVIYQDFSIFPNLSVAENIALSYHVQKKKKFIDYKLYRDLAKKALEKIGVCMDLDTEVGLLSVAEKQIVAICRAIVQDAKLIIMDEPTSAITKKEIDRLFEIIHGLKEQGIAVIFVSHKLDEVLAICDRIFIIRNGEMIVDMPVEEFPKDKLVYYMTGKEISEDAFVYRPRDEKPLIELRNATRKGEFENVSFKVNPGEILAITGQLGSGRTELAKALFGLAPLHSGQIFIEGKEAVISSPYDALRYGIAYLPEDRLTEGLFMNRSLGDNFSAVVIDTMTDRLGIVREKKIEKLSNYWMNKLDMTVKHYSTPASNFSGGNQQRIVLGKWLATNPRIFVLNCPTMGVDVKSKSEIHNIIKQLAGDGMSIIMISDDLGEIMSTSNRVLVMNAGRVIFESNTHEITMDDINEKILSTIN